MVDSKPITITNTTDPAAIAIAKEFGSPVSLTATEKQKQDKDAATKTAITEKTATEKKDVETPKGDRVKAFFRIKIGGAISAPAATDTTKTSADKDKDKDKADTTKDTVAADGATAIPKAEAKTDTKTDEKVKATINSATPVALTAASKKKEREKEVAEGINKDKKTNIATDSEIPSFTFDQAEGDILGRPIIVLEEGQHDYAEFILNDPEDKIRPSLAGQLQVEIEIGYIGLDTNKIFSGIIKDIGRKLPTGTIIKAVDPGALAQGSQTGVFNTKTGIPTSEEAKLATDIGSGKLSDIAFTTTKVDSKTEDLLTTVSAANKVGEERTSVSATLVDEFAEVVPGKFTLENKSKVILDRYGQFSHNESKMGAITKEAGMQGDKVNADASGNTVITSPGTEPSSGIILDYENARSTFIGHPEILKPTGLQLSAYGAWQVSGFSSVDKDNFSATVVVPGQIPFPTSASIDIPGWGTVKMSDPISKGLIFTWGDATKNGTRKPTQEIMGQIIKIAQVMDGLCKKYNGGKKMTINSWYRDPASNRACGGVPNSRHLRGDAVDFYHPSKLKQIHSDLVKEWNGGVAIKYDKNGSAVFVHIDLGEKRRWTYG